MEGMSSKMLWMVAGIPFLFSFSITGLLVLFSNKINVFASQDKRRQQVKPIPLLGGLGIHFGIFAFLFIKIYYGLNIPGVSMTPLFFALLIAITLGIYDDKAELHSKVKFAGQNIIAILLLAALYSTKTPIHQFISDSPWIVLPIQWFWFLGLVNSINLIDGLDGLAGGIGVIVLSFLSILFFQQFHQPSLFGIAATSSIIGFLFWNRHPAKIYMGESGSIVIGISIFIASMRLTSSSASFITIAAPILAVGIPAFDTLVAIIRRSKRRTSIGSGDRDHLHHRLLRLGISHKSVVRIFYSITIYLCLLSYSLFPNNQFSPLTATISLSGILIIIFLIVLVERKLYTYLKNFGDQMLQVMDTQNYGSITTLMRMINLKEQSVDFRAFRINLENCIQALLVASPGRIHTFYTDLCTYIKSDSLLREVYFENSTTLFVIQKSTSNANEQLFKQDLLQILMEFEKEKSIDLYLSVPNTLKEIDHSEVIETARVENNDKSVYSLDAG